MMKQLLFGIFLSAFLLNISYCQNSNKNSSASQELSELYSLAENFLNNNIDSALILSEKGLAQAKETGSKEWIARFLKAIGRCHLLKGNYEKSLDYIQNSIDLFNELSDVHGEYSSKFYLALVNFYLNNLSKSESLYTECKEYFESINDSLKIAQCYNNVGLIKIKEEKYDEALENLHKAAFLKEKLNLRKSLSVTNNNIADVYLSTNNFDSAKLIYKNNLSIGAELNNYTLLAASYTGLAIIDINTNFTPNTLNYLHKAKGYLNAVQSGEMLKVLYDTYAEYYNLKGDYKSALTYYKKFHAISDSLLNGQKQSAIEELQILYETDKKNQEIENLKNSETLNRKIIRQHRIISYVAIVFSLFTIIVLIMFIWLFNKQKRLNAELKILNVTKDRFFSVIAHDLRNPFSRLMGYSELILKKYESLHKDKIRSYTGQIYDSSTRIYTLLEDLLAWARNQSGQLKSVNEDVRLFDLVQSLSQFLEESFNEKHIIFQNEIPEDIVLYTDKEILSIVIRNLLFNAQKYTESGYVKVYLEQMDNRIGIVVEDTGVGMSKNQIEELSYSTMEKSMKGTRGEKGTGLGLQLCFELIEKIDGEIHLKSEEKVGTSVYILIPQRYNS